MNRMYSRMYRTIASVVLTVLAIAPVQVRAERPAPGHCDHQAGAKALGHQSTEAHEGHGGPETSRRPDSPDTSAITRSSEHSAEWSAEGRYLDACRCNAPCPCHFGLGSDYGTCDPSMVFHITEGHYEDTPLSGLSVAIVAGSGFKRIYVDSRAGPGQQQALAEIGRYFYATLLRDGLTISASTEVVVAPMTVRLGDEQAQVSIQGALDIVARTLVGGDGEGRIQLRNLDLGPDWMLAVWAGQSDVYRYDDAATWDYSGQNAYFGRFSAQSGTDE